MMSIEIPAAASNPKDRRDKKLGLSIQPTFGATLIDPKGNKVEGLFPPTSPGHMSKREYLEIANTRQSITSD
jgi:hypothetical protein